MHTLRTYNTNIDHLPRATYGFGRALLCRTLPFVDRLPKTTHATGTYVSGARGRRLATSVEMEEGDGRGQGATEG
jgi:hypothetical protein